MPEQLALGPLIVEFANLLTAKCKELVATGSIRRISVPYARWKPTDKANPKSGMSLETFVEKVWNFEEEPTSLSGILDPLVETREVVNAICRSGKMDEFAAMNLVRGFASYLMKNYLDSGNPNVIHAAVETITVDVCGGRKKQEIFALLKGIEIEGGEIRIRDGLVIRNVGAAEIERWSTRRIYGIVTPGIGDFHWHYGSAILELSEICDSYNELRKQFDAVLWALRLIRTGSVDYLEVNTRINSFGQRVGITRKTLPRPADFSYKLQSEDVEKLLKICDLVNKEVLPRVGTDPKEPDFISIALDRYAESILDSVHPERRLTSAIMVLEALYLGDDQGELSLRLSLLSARLLSCFGVDAQRVYRQVTQAYDFRSKYLHGTPLSKEEKATVTGLVSDLVDYARLSLLAFLHFPTVEEKKKRLGLVLISLLEVKAFENLRKMAGSIQV